MLASILYSLHPINNDMYLERLLFNLKRSNYLVFNEEVELKLEEFTSEELRKRYSLSILKDEVIFIYNVKAYLIYIIKYVTINKNYLEATMNFACITIFYITLNILNIFSIL